MSSLRQVVTLAGRRLGYLVKGSRQLIYRPCQNWLNLRDLAPASSSFFRPNEGKTLADISQRYESSGSCNRYYLAPSGAIENPSPSETVVYVNSSCASVSSIYLECFEREKERNVTIKEKLPRKLRGEL